MQYEIEFICTFEFFQSPLFSFTFNQIVCVPFQIRKFSFQMIHQPIKLNAFEFFNIDYTLIFKVILK